CGEPAVAAGAVAAEPGPAVDVDDYRQGLVVLGRLREQKVELLTRVVSGGGGDVGLQLDCLGQFLPLAWLLGRHQRRHCGYAKHYGGDCPSEAIRRQHCTVLQETARSFTCPGGRLPRTSPGTAPAARVWRVRKPGNGRCR